MSRFGVAHRSASIMSYIVKGIREAVKGPGEKSINLDADSIQID